MQFMLKYTDEMNYQQRFLSPNINIHLHNLLVYRCQNVDCRAFLSNIKLWTTLLAILSHFRSSWNQTQSKLSVYAFSLVCFNI